MLVRFTCSIKPAKLKFEHAKKSGSCQTRVDLSYSFCIFAMLVMLSLFMATIWLRNRNFSYKAFDRNDDNKNNRQIIDLVQT